MDSCEAVKVASEHIEKILYELSEGNTSSDYNKVFNALKIMDALSLTPCMQCGPCHDYYYYSMVLVDLAEEKISNEELKKKLLLWRKAQLTDMALTCLAVSPDSTDFNKHDCHIDGLKIYLDQNVLSECAKNESVRELVRELKTRENLCFYYSPSHLEEIYKVPNEKTKQLLIDTLEEITDNIVILPEIGSHRFYIEPPSYGLNRIAKADGSTQCLEEQMLASSNERKLFVEKYDTDQHRSNIANNPDIFNSLSEPDFRELVFLSQSDMYEKDSYREIENRSKLLHAIYTLSKMLNLIGYKLDKKEKKIKSALHDNEHLVYASEAEFFVTDDEPLRYRAKQIFKFMNIPTKVVSFEEFIWVFNSENV